MVSEKKLIFNIVLGLVLISFFIFGYNELSVYNNEYNVNWQTVTPGEIYNLGDYQIKYLGLHDLTSVILSFGGQDYAVKVGESVKINNYFSIKLNKITNFDLYVFEQLVRKTKVDFVILTTNNDYTTMLISDEQQKLLGGDKAIIKLCNNAKINFIGGVETFENYEDNSQSVSNTNFDFNVGCKDYNINLNNKYYGRNNVEFSSYITLKDVILTFSKKPVIYDLCKQGGVEWVSTTHCNNAFVDYDTFNDYVFTKVVTDAKLFNNQYFYPYVVVDNIQNRTSISCADKQCPNNYKCVQTQYNSKDYFVCMQDNYKIIGEQKIIEPMPKDYSKLFWVIIGSIIFILLLYFFVRWLK